MPNNLTSPRTRRALLSAGLGAAAATVVSALPTAAVVNPPLLLRQDNPTDAETSVTNSSSGFTAIKGESKQAGLGVYGVSAQASGVIGESTSWVGLEGINHAPDQAGLMGWAKGNNTGVMGYSGSANPPATSPVKTGVYGYAVQAAASVGVLGESSLGTGVVGKTSSGVGVRGRATAGRGGQFSGGAAQLRLVPATGAHPTSGQAGDLFLDKGKSLWLCKGGSTWVKLG
jgi:hypothetical protein